MRTWSGIAQTTYISQLRHLQKAYVGLVMPALSEKYGRLCACCLSHSQLVLEENWFFYLNFGEKIVFRHTYEAAVSLQRSKRYTRAVSELARAPQRAAFLLLFWISNFFITVVPVFSICFFSLSVCFFSFPSTFEIQELFFILKAFKNTACVCSFLTKWSRKGLIIF